jgi:hypothetical protein
MRHLAFLPLLAGLTAAADTAPALRPSTPVAVELFTSQGCSSCPPADALVERLAKEPNTIILTRPVTYWDRLGWKDTLAREANTQLQHAYSRRGGRGAGVYTPQAVVQGGAAVVGSREAELRALIAIEKARPGPQIKAQAKQDGGRVVEIDQSVRANASVSVVALKHDVVVRIGSGENGGRTVRYTNVVLAETSVGQWSGGQKTIAIAGSILSHSGADRYALVLREGAAGRIIAARYI